MARNKKICPICKSTQIQPHFKAQKTNYFFCKNCSLVFTLKLPRISYENYDLSHYLKLERFLKNAFRKQIKAIKKYKPKGVVLEIGSGMGYMMELLKTEGYKVKGIEPAASLVEYSIKNGLDVDKGYFEQVDLKGTKFDVVIINHVLEHILDPINFLKKIKKALKTDGILFLQVPNFGSFEARIMKQNWSYLVPNDHYLQFNHKTMKLVLTKVGLEIIEARTT